MTEEKNQLTEITEPTEPTKITEPVKKDGKYYFELIKDENERNELIGLATEKGREDFAVMYNDILKDNATNVGVVRAFAHCKLLKKNQNKNDNNGEVKKLLRALAIEVDSIKRNTKYKSLSITKKLKQDRLIGSKIKVSLEYICCDLLSAQELYETYIKNDNKQIETECEKIDGAIYFDESKTQDCLREVFEECDNIKTKILNNKIMVDTHSTGDLKPDFVLTDEKLDCDLGDMYKDAFCCMEVQSSNATQNQYLANRVEAPISAQLEYHRERLFGFGILISSKKTVPTVGKPISRRQFELIVIINGTMFYSENKNTKYLGRVLAFLSHLDNYTRGYFGQLFKTLSFDVSHLNGLSCGSHSRVFRYGNEKIIKIFKSKKFYTKTKTSLDKLSGVAPSLFSKAKKYHDNNNVIEFNYYIREALNSLINPRSFIELVHFLEAAHKKDVFHGDITPDNILYDDSQGKIILNDWSSSGSKIDTVEYRTPQFKGDDDTFCAQADLHMLCKTIWFIFRLNGKQRIELTNKYQDFWYELGVNDTKFKTFIGFANSGDYKKIIIFLSSLTQNNNNNNNDNVEEEIPSFVKDDKVEKETYEKYEKSNNNNNNNNNNDENNTNIKQKKRKRNIETSKKTDSKETSEQNISHVQKKLKNNDENPVVTKISPV